MSFHITNVGRLQSGDGKRLADHPGLCRAVWHRQATAWPVLIDGRAIYHSPDRIAVALCVGQPLEHHKTAALATRIPVGCCVESLAAAVRRQHVCLGKVDKGFRAKDQIDTCGQGHVAFTIAQRLTRQVRRDE